MAFENKSFDFSVCNYVFEAFDLRNKHLDFDAVMVFFVEIAQNTAFKDFGLADINNLVIFVIIEITPRKRRKKF